MTDEPIGVTGATGRIGGKVARLLSDAGVAQRLIVRDPTRAPTLSGTAVVSASYDDQAAARFAMTGLSVVFMVSGAESAERVAQHRRFIDAAVDAGVEHVVYLSFFGASPDATFTLARDHWATEEYLRSTGLRWTFLRDNLYSDFVTSMVGDDGVIRGPAGDGRAAMVAQDDIAEAVTAVLRDPSSHEGATYDLTGPEAITLAEAAEVVSTVTGRPVTYEPETLEQAYRSRAHYGAPDWQVDAWVSTYTAIAAGELERVDPAVVALTGHRARSLADVLSAVPD
ncbi:MAG: SDR family oxidoreductase [Microthrixaceae bacterium]